MFYTSSNSKLFVDKIDNKHDVGNQNADLTKGVAYLRNLFYFESQKATNRKGKTNIVLFIYLITSYFWDFLYH